MKQFISSLFLLVFALTTGFSQEYGHVNFGNLLSAMPNTKSAETQLESYNQELIAAGEKMVKELQTEFRAVQADQENIAPVKLREYEMKFQQRQQEIVQYEQQISVKLEQKRQELLGPLIKQARDAIDAVAKEKGLKMVFDSSLFNALLFTEESTDLLPAVRAKLGIE